MLDQIIFQQASQLTHNGIHRGLSEQESTEQAKKTIDSILSKSKQFATKFKDLNQTLVFQQLSQIAIGKILSGADPNKAIEEASNIIEDILNKTKEFLSNFKNLNQTLVFQQMSQMAFGKILSGADPNQSVNEAATTIGSILRISEDLTKNSGLLD